MAKRMPHGRLQNGRRHNGWRRSLPVWRRQRGYNFLVMVFAVALFAIALGATVPSLAQAMRAEREADMILQAQTLARAIKAYALTGQGGLHRNPQSLVDLLEDKRFGNARRYLREVPWDAMTHSYDWGVVRGEDGGVIGVYSQSDLAPLRVKAPAGVKATEGAEHYSDWHFMASSIN